MTRMELAKFLDHTLLRPDSTPDDIRQLVSDALQWGVYAVCINSDYVTDAANARQNHQDLKIAATVGFPFGQASTQAKRTETQVAIDQGADEIDMVWALGRYLAGQTARVHDDIAAVVQSAAGRPVKVILETAQLTDEQIYAGSILAVQAGAHMVKTSTGYGAGGASVNAVRIMRQAVGLQIGVKASGGIRTYDDAVALIDAGATRIGLSATGTVLNQASQP